AGSSLLPRHTLDRAGPQLEIGATQAGLDLKCAAGIRQPVFGHAADRLDHIGDVFGAIALDLAFLARLQIRGERLAPFFDEAGNVVRQGLDIDIADRGRFCGWLVHTRAPADRSGPDRVLLQATFERMVTPSLPRRDPNLAVAILARYQDHAIMH